MRRFSIRTLLVITFIVALFLAIPFQKAHQQKQGREWVASQRGHVGFEHPLDYTSGTYSIPMVPQFMISLLGVDQFNSVTSVMLDCEEVVTLAPISNLTTLNTLVINIEMANDIDFSPLKELPQLKEIHFTEWSRLNKQQLAKLRNMLPDVTIFCDLEPSG